MELSLEITCTVVLNLKSRNGFKRRNNISVKQSDMGYERTVILNIDEVTSIPYENSKSM
jgi:hypothetical protein